MADLFRKGAAWLGLVADDRYAYEDDAEDTGAYDQSDVEEQAPRTRQRPAAVAPSPRGSTAVTALPSRESGDRWTRPVEEEEEAEPSVADLSRIITVHPRTYNEARTIGEHFRDGVPVIMNLSEMEDVDAKRLVDFAAGLVFGRQGTIERVTSKVFLLSPHNVSVAAEDKQRIAGSFFNQS